MDFFPLPPYLPFFSHISLPQFVYFSFSHFSFSHLYRANDLSRPNR